MHHSIPILLMILLTGCDHPDRDRAQTMTGGNYDAGKSTITLHGCGSCHTIPGIRGANALVGPPLDRIAARSYIGGVLPNSPENMVRWIQNAPGVDPMTAMPNLHLTESEARDVASYLYTLR